jgi:hypothetical protein
MHLTTDTSLVSSYRLLMAYKEKTAASYLRNTENKGCNWYGDLQHLVSNVELVFLKSRPLVNSATYRPSFQTKYTLARPKTPFPHRTLSYARRK